MVNNGYCVVADGNMTLTEKGEKLLAFKSRRGSRSSATGYIKQAHTILGYALKELEDHSGTPEETVIVECMQMISNLTPVWSENEDGLEEG
jgi:hypothetical protein